MHVQEREEDLGNYTTGEGFLETTHTSQQTVQVTPGDEFLQQY